MSSGRRAVGALVKSWRVLLVMPMAMGVSLGVGPSSALADHCDVMDFSGVLVDVFDVPSGFALVPDLTGELDANRLGELARGQDVSGLVGVCGYVEVWSRSEDDGLQATVFNMYANEAAEDLYEGLADVARARAVENFDVPGVANETAVVIDAVLPSNAPGRTTLSLFRHEHYVFTFARTAPVADQALVSQLTVNQATRASARTANTDDAISENRRGNVTGSFMFAVLVYVVGVSALARRRDPVRRRRRRDSPIPPRHSARSADIDVSAISRQKHQRARIGFASQLVGLSLLVSGTIPMFWPATIVDLVLGVVLVTRVPERIWRRWRRSPGRDQRRWTNQRSLRVRGLQAVAAGLLVVGFGLAALSMVTELRDNPLVVGDPAGEHTVIEPGTLSLLQLAGAILVFATAVAASRRARQLAALDARALMDRDERPIVLYLRHFADDGLQIRTGATGRRSLIEQLSPRRFYRFEEVLAWHLNELGPVVAVNPPGTTVSPLGAARTTLDDGEWRDTIDEWMRRAALIVVAAPPARTTPGLQWELECVERHRSWAKTVFVLPPVPDDELRDRWARFSQLLAWAAPWCERLPVDPAAALLARTQPGVGWSVITADERTEWSYAEALSAAAPPGRGSTTGELRSVVGR